MRIVPYILYLLMIALHAVVLDDATRIYTAGINLTALIVLLVAIYKDDLAATWFGFFAGLIWAGGLPSQMGWYALMTAIVALAACFVRERLNLDSMRAKFLLVFGGLFTHNLAALVISRSDGFWHLLWSSVLLGAIYTSILGWFFFLVKEGHLTAKRVKALF
jgi:cell shape-determining protein MreD